MSGDRSLRGDPATDDHDDPATGEAAAHEAALRLLAVRARSRAELERRLARRGFPPGGVAAAVDRLQRAGLVDDTAFADELAATRVARGAAAGRVRRDLIARGVDAATATRAASAASPPDQEAERIQAAAATWLDRHPGLPAEVAARRLAGHLARRGYPRGLIAGVLAGRLNPLDLHEDDP
ncbi:MAG TPA: regulatory protein RecX [Actinomycetes bacterium]|nr:regulatory protein RecX [Actinomycetes bacterium]